MKADRILIAFAVLLLFVGGALGALIYWAVSPSPTATVVVPQRIEVEVPRGDSATIFAEGRLAGRSDVRPIIRTVHDTGETRVEVVYDSSAISAGMEAYRLLDSVLAVHGELTDLVAHQFVALPPDHTLELFYRVRERSFRDSRVVCTRPDTARFVEIPEARTFWSRWGWGPEAQISIVEIGPGRPRWFAGASIGLGIHYSF